MSQLMHLGPDDDGRRLDRIVRKLYPDLPLSRIYSLFRKGDVRLNGAKGKADSRGREGDTLSIRLPGVAPEPTHASPEHRNSPTQKSLRSQSLLSPLSRLIVWEDENLLILNKPRGVTAHGPDSLLPAVNAYLSNAGSGSLSFRPGPVHRLDRNTTGLQVYAKTLRGAQHFSTGLKDRSIHKSYIGLLTGAPPELGNYEHWRDRLKRDKKQERSRVSAGKHDSTAQTAETVVRCLLSSGPFSLALLEPQTGRTHQIRAQAAAHGHPLAGDTKYGSAHQPGGYILHAFMLSFDLPGTVQLGAVKPAPVQVRAALPSSSHQHLVQIFGMERLNTVLVELGIQSETEKQR